MGDSLDFFSSRENESFSLQRWALREKGIAARKCKTLHENGKRCTYALVRGPLHHCISVSRLIALAENMQVLVAGPAWRRRTAASRPRTRAPSPLAASLSFLSGRVGTLLARTAVL
jgi:hypothetical protein